jgi:hypothetical protein
VAKAKTSGSRSKPARLPLLTLEQYDELAHYFSGEEPREPGPMSPVWPSIYVTPGKLAGRGGSHTSLQEDHRHAEDDMVSWLDDKRVWYATHTRFSSLSDASANALAAWFATPEKDRHRAVGADLLLLACKEWSGLQ